MRGFDDVMLFIGDKLFLGTGESAPKNEDHRFFPFIQKLDNAVGENTPADFAVAVGNALAYG